MPWLRVPTALATGSVTLRLRSVPATPGGPVLAAPLPAALATCPAATAAVFATAKPLVDLLARTALLAGGVLHAATRARMACSHPWTRAYECVSLGGADRAAMLPAAGTVLFIVNGACHCNTFNAGDSWGGPLCVDSPPAPALTETATVMVHATQRYNLARVVWYGLDSTAVSPHAHERRRATVLATVFAMARHSFAHATPTTPDLPESFLACTATLAARFSAACAIRATAG